MVTDHRKSVIHAIEAQPPVANTLVPRPEPVQPVTLPSVIVSVSFPSVPLYTKVALGLRQLLQERALQKLEDAEPNVQPKGRPHPLRTWPRHSVERLTVG